MAEKKRNQVVNTSGLKMIGSGAYTKEEEQDIFRKSATANLKSNRERRTAKMIAQWVMDMNPNLGYTQQEMLKKLGIPLGVDDQSRVTVLSVAIAMQALKAQAGDAEALQLLLRIQGEDKPEDVRALEACMPQVQIVCDIPRPTQENAEDVYP